jgi:hypothetical protein
MAGYQLTPINLNLKNKMNDKTFSRITVVLILAVFSSTTITAQVVQKFGSNSFTINPKAVLELESTTKGFLPPRMTANQQAAMGTSLPNGLVVYILDGASVGLQIWNGTTWTTFGADGNLALKAPLESPTFTGTVSGITASMVGLGNVNNTSDLQKPISTITQTALDTKEDKANKSLDIITDQTSDIKYPSVKAVKSYVDVYASFNAISTITANYTATRSDYTILANNNSAAFQLTLPSASATSGKIYVIRKTDESTNVLTISPSLKLTETTSISTLDYPKTIRVQSNGSYWYIID